MSGAGDAYVRWHHYRPWARTTPAHPPPGVDDPCGGCGRPLTEHPIPGLAQGDEATARELLRLRSVISGVAVDADSTACSHLYDWSSDPVTAENHGPNHRCSSCGAVMLEGAVPPGITYGPEGTARG